jgi:hypothetical protein
MPSRILLLDFVAEFPFKDKDKEKRYSKKLDLSTLFPKENYHDLSPEKKFIQITEQRLKQYN